MAVPPTGPSGFSYAQAAKSRPTAPVSQSSSSKVPSGAVTPATGTTSEVSSKPNWADEMENSFAEKVAKSEKEDIKDAKSSHQTESPESAAGAEDRKISQLRDTAIDRTKMEEKAQSSSPATSSPDLLASSAASNHADDRPVARNRFGVGDHVGLQVAGIGARVDRGAQRETKCFE